jgi:hypothetical protein
MHELMAAGAAFELRAPDIQSGGGFFGVWRSLPIDSVVSLDAASPQTAEPPEWRISLPADPSFASARIAAAEQAIAATDAALPVAIRRVSAVARTSPERLLVPDQATVEVVFSPFDQLAGLAQTAQELAAQLGSVAAPRASVRTSLGGTWVGWTVIDGVGRVANLCAPTASLDQSALHARSVSLVLRSRISLLRTFSLAVRISGLIATSLATPIGPLIAVPLAWRLITDAQAELRSQIRAAGAF